MSPQSSGNPDMKERFELAKNLYEAKRYKESAAAFSELTSSSDFAARGFYGLGLIQFSLGDRNGAAANFRRVFAHDPTDANSFYFLGLIAEQQGNPNGAQLFYRMALASNQQHVSAKARFDRLKQQQPTNADAHKGGSLQSTATTHAV